MSEDRKKAVEGIIKSINTHFKSNVINLGKDVAEDLRIDFIKTRSFKLNQLLGGGIARGRITEIYGNTGSGKTTLCYETIGFDMKKHEEGYWVWFETEKSYDSEAAERFGIDMDRLLYIEMDDNGAESGLDAIESVIRQGEGLIRGIVINSVAGLTPKRELDTLMDKQDMGVQAKMMSKLMRKITAIAGKSKIAVIFINQIRDKISLFGGTTTTGGRALSFFSSQRIEMRKAKIEASDGVDDEEYIKLVVKSVKNRCIYDRSPLMTTTLYARYGVGTDMGKEIVDIGSELGIIEKRGGGNYRYVNDAGEELKWRGAKAINDAFADDEALIAEVAFKIDQVGYRTEKLSDEEIEALEKYNAGVVEEMTVIEQEDLKEAI